MEIRNITQATCSNVNSTPNFKKSAKPVGKVTEFMAEHYGKRIVNSEWIRNKSEYLAKRKIGDVSTHFQVLGSFITSSAYAISTLTNDNFDKDNAITLAYNQGLCFVVPTIGAYVVDHYINDTKKQIEYNYAAKQQKHFIDAKLKGKSAKELDEMLVKQGKNLKAVRTLIGIVSTTLMYRYITPVAVTPGANSIGRLHKKIRDERRAKKAQTVQMDNSAKYVSSPKSTDAKQAVTVKMNNSTNNTETKNKQLRLSA